MNRTRYFLKNTSLFLKKKKKTNYKKEQRKTRQTKKDEKQNKNKTQIAKSAVLIKPMKHFLLIALTRQRSVSISSISFFFFFWQPAWQLCDSPRFTLALTYFHHYYVLSSPSARELGQWYRSKYRIRFWT